MEAYDLIKKIYKDKLNIDEEIIDLLSEMDIMYYCATGTSNLAISNLLNIDIETVENILKNRFNFSGWKDTLDFNPLFVYNKSKGIEEFYYKIIMAILNYPKFILKKSYEIANLYTQYEKIIDEKFK